MKLSDIFGIALGNLYKSKLRTALTTLAVVIGALLIALMLSVSDGLKSFITNQFGSYFHEQSITVFKGSYSFGGGPQEITENSSGSTEPLTQEDFENIAKIANIEAIYFNPNFNAKSVQAQDSDRLFTASTSCLPIHEQQLRPLATGIYVDYNGSGQAVISYSYAKVFGWSASEAIGKNITITVGKMNPFSTSTQEYTFTVCGVLDESLAMTSIFLSFPDAADMGRFYADTPNLYTEAMPGYILTIKASSAENAKDIAADISAIDKKLNAMTYDDVMTQINSAFNVIQIGLSSFGIIALVVAAIGIINTLIMAIYERTREIGIMKATGATKGDIRLLFTVESAAIGFFGGAIGVSLAMIIGWLLNVIGAQTFLSAFPNFHLSVFTPLVVIGVILLTTIISVIAGIYPSNRAANLDPIEALRYE